MRAPIRPLSFVMALSFATAMMPQASGQSQLATSALSPATQERNSFNKGKGGATSMVVGGRTIRHNPRQVRRPHRESWWNIIG
jgi:hypothetical protein